MVQRLALGIVCLLLAGAWALAPSTAPHFAARSYPPPIVHADGLDGAGIPVPTPLPPPPSISGLQILIPQLGIDLPLVAGQLPEPRLGDAEVYPGMKWPGQGGRSFIYAHAQPGMFGALLGSGAVGQKVQVLAPDGQRLHYVITQFTRNWPVTDTSILQPADHEELVLYTCTSWTYSDPKVVAFAEPDPNP